MFSGGLPLNNNCPSSVTGEKFAIHPPESPMSHQAVTPYRNNRLCRERRTDADFPLLMLIATVSPGNANPLMVA